MKYNQQTIDRLEGLLSAVGYVVRFERGTFQSGYCILDQKKVVVLNKYLQVEGRINALLDIIPRVIPSPDVLSEEDRKTYELIHAKA